MGTPTHHVYSGSDATLKDYCLFGGCLLIIVGIFLTVVAFFAHGIYTSLVNSAQYGDPVDVSHGQTLTLTGARGEHLFWRIHVSQSIAGIWATPQGLNLRLSNLATGFSVTQEVVPATGPLPESITYQQSQTQDNVIIAGSWTIPDLPGPEIQTLSGTLSGEIDTAMASEFSANGFTFGDYSFPVQIHILPPAQAQAQERAQWLGSHIEFVISVGCGGGVLLASGVLLGVFLRYRHRTRRK